MYPKFTAGSSTYTGDNWDKFRDVREKKIVKLN
jgi:hypothetical protein